MAPHALRTVIFERVANRAHPAKDALGQLFVAGNPSPCEMRINRPRLDDNCFRLSGLPVDRLNARAALVLLGQRRAHRQLTFVVLVELAEVVDLVDLAVHDAVPLCRLAPAELPDRLLLDLVSRDLERDDLLAVTG